MTQKPVKTRGLGRGLSALMSDVAPVAATSDAPPAPERHLPIEQVVPNPDQPRRSFSEDALDDLARSIAEKGIIQPLIVRPKPGTEATFEIVAGERRWRAAQKARLHEVPVIVRELDDTEVLEIAIIENIQRDDLNPIDEAQAYHQLMDRFGHTQEQLAKALGKSRSHIANQLRLTTLPEEVQSFLRDGRLSAGHARALVGRDNAPELARQIVKKGLSVRQAEALAKKPESKGSRTTARPGPDKDADTKALEGELSATLGLRASIDHNADGGGKLTLHYRDLEQLDDLLRVLSGG